MGLKVARTKEFDVQIGRNIKAIRTRAGLTQETLGESLGVSFQQIQKYERGSNRVSAGALVHFQKALGCDLKDFFEGIDIDGARTGAAAMSEDAVKVSTLVNALPPWKQSLVVSLTKQVERACPED
jgi:transcriptional regulator with XRE-family HTH domain